MFDGNWARGEEVITFVEQPIGMPSLWNDLVLEKLSNQTLIPLKPAG